LTAELLATPIVGNPDIPLAIDAKVPSAIHRDVAVVSAEGSIAIERCYISIAICRNIVASSNLISAPQVPLAR
jgi:hypothetical protein